MIAATSPGQVCQLCECEALEEFVVPGKTTLWKCPNCELYQYGATFDENSQGAAWHLQWNRTRSRKLRTARVRANRIAPLVTAKRPRLLDVGCSVGCFLEAAKERGWQAVGVDVSRDAVKYCQEHGLNAESFNGHRLPFENDSFDVVTAWHVIEHVGDVRQTLAEWGRVLRAGGVLVLETPDASSPKVRRRGASYSKFWPLGHTYTFSPSNLGQFVQQADFELISPPLLGPISRLSPWMAGYAVAYQASHGLRRLMGVHKAFQIFARRTMGVALH